MRAIVVEQHGGLEALQSVECETPRPGPGEVRVRVAACGVNHLDVWVRRGVAGHTFPLPLIPGSDVAGVVDALGDGVDDLPEGSEVIVAPATSCAVCVMCLSGRDHRCRKYRILGEHRDGGYAEAIVVPRANLLLKPPQLSFVQAAGIGIPFLTAWHMLVARAELRPGETVLIQAAGSGVGSAAIQIARLWGATVIATAGSDDKLARARQLGAHELINYQTESVAARVKELTNRVGVDVVVDHVGTATWEQSIRSLAWQGRLVTCGATTGADARIDLRVLFFKALSLLGSTMGSKGEFAEVVGHVANGALTPVIDQTLPLERAREAHALLEERRVFGKIVLTP